MINPIRWTPFTFVAPNRYVEKNSFWKHFDLRTWSWEDYLWELDEWNGYKDFAQRPRKTVMKNRGDCEDYALVAASWAVSNERDGVKLGFCWEKGKYHPTHAICHDSEYVYSSGNIVNESINGWVSSSRYHRVISRSVNK